MHLLFECEDLAAQAGRRTTIWGYFSMVATGWWGTQRANVAKRKSLIRLADMEEWQLRDIGLTRADVEHTLRRNGLGRDLVEQTQPH